MRQQTLTAPIHSPEGDSTHVSSNSASKNHCTIKTGGQSCSELPSNITWSTFQGNWAIHDWPMLTFTTHITIDRCLSLLKGGDGVRDPTSTTNLFENSRCSCETKI